MRLFSTFKKPDFLPVSDILPEPSFGHGSTVVLKDGSLRFVVRTRLSVKDNGLNVDDVLSVLSRQKVQFYVFPHGGETEVFVVVSKSRRKGKSLSLEDDDRVLRDRVQMLCLLLDNKGVSYRLCSRLFLVSMLEQLYSPSKEVRFPVFDACKKPFVLSAGKTFSSADPFLEELLAPLCPLQTDQYLHFAFDETFCSCLILNDLNSLNELKSFDFVHCSLICEKTKTKDNKTENKVSAVAVVYAGSLKQLEERVSIVQSVCSSAIISEKYGCSGVWVDSLPLAVSAKRNYGFKTNKINVLLWNPAKNNKLKQKRKIFRFKKQKEHVVVRDAEEIVDEPIVVAGRKTKQKLVFVGSIAAGSAAAVATAVFSRKHKK